MPEATTTPPAATATTTTTAPATTTTATTEPFYQSWGLDADGVKFVTDRGFTDPGAMVKSHISADRVATSRSVIQKPDLKNLDAWEGWAEAGWVAEPDKYAIAKPKEIPTGVEYSGEMFEEFRKAAHEAHVPAPMAQKMHDRMWGWMLEGIKKLQTSGAAERHKLDTGLREEWKGDYDRKRTLAERAMSAFNPNPNDTALIGQLMGQAPLVKMFATIGEALGEAHLPAAAAGGGVPASIEALEGELNRFEADAANLQILRDERNPRHKEVADARQALINKLAAAQARKAA